LVCVSIFIISSLAEKWNTSNWRVTARKDSCVLLFDWWTL